MPYVLWCHKDCDANNNDDDDDDESKTYMQYCTVSFSGIYNNSAESPDFYCSDRCSKEVKLEK